MRFRRRFKIAPGVTLNVGKKSVGVRVGGRGYGVSANSRTGTRATVGIPGSGFSYSTSARRAKSYRANSGAQNASGCLGWLIAGSAIIAVSFRSIFFWVVAIGLLTYVVAVAIGRARGASEALERARVRLNLENSSSFDRDRAALQSLVSNANRYSEMKAIWNYRVVDGTENGTSAPVSINLVREGSPNAKRFVMANPRVTMLGGTSAHFEEALLLAPGVLLLARDTVSPPTAYQWRDLTATIEQSVVRELERSVPSGAKVVGKSWLHVKTDGAPDRRYKDNPRVSLVEYSDLVLAKSGSEILRFRLLAAELAAAFASHLGLEALAPRSSARADRQAEQPRDSSRRHSDAQKPRTTANARTPHEVLGVPVGADHATIRKAYIELVKQYHPDRVANLAPEIKELAGRRMREINRAYEDIGGK